MSNRLQQISDEGMKGSVPHKLLQNFSFQEQEIEEFFVRPQVYFSVKRFQISKQQKLLRILTS